MSDDDKKAEVGTPFGKFTVGGGKPLSDELKASIKLFGLEAATATSSAAVEYTVTSLGYDATDMKAMLEGLDTPHLQALQDRTLHPSDVNVPKPTGFDEQKYVGVTASFSVGIQNDRKEQSAEVSKGKDRRVSLTTAIIAAVVTLVVGAVGAGLLFGGSDDQEHVQESAPTE